MPNKIKIKDSGNVEPAIRDVSETEKSLDPSQIVAALGADPVSEPLPVSDSAPWSRYALNAERNRRLEKPAHSVVDLHQLEMALSRFAACHPLEAELIHAHNIELDETIHSFMEKIKLDINPAVQAMWERIGIGLKNDEPDSENAKSIEGSTPLRLQGLRPELSKQFYAIWFAKLAELAAIEAMQADEADESASSTQSVSAAASSSD